MYRFLQSFQQKHLCGWVVQRKVLERIGNIKETRPLKLTYILWAKVLPKVLALNLMYFNESLTSNKGILIVVIFALLVDGFILRFMIGEWMVGGQKILSLKGS